MNEVVKIVSQNLKYFRKEKGLTQEIVAKYLGVSRPVYTHYESGYREISLLYLYKLSELYKITPAYFFIPTDYIRIGEYSLVYSYLDALLRTNLDLNKLMTYIDKYDSDDNKNFSGAKYEELIDRLELKQKEYNDYLKKLRKTIKSNKLNEEVNKYFK